MVKLTKSQKAKSKKLYDKMVDVPYEEPKARLEIAASVLPDIKGWEVGKTYNLEIKGKMISKSEGGWDGKQPLRATFEIATASPDADYDEDD